MISKEMNAHELIHLFYLVCEMLACRCIPISGHSDALPLEEVTYICGRTSTTLFETIAEVLKVDPETVYQQVKNLLRLEDEYSLDMCIKSINSLPMQKR